MQPPNKTQIQDPNNQNQPPSANFYALAALGHKADVFGDDAVAAAFRSAALQDRLGIEPETPAKPGSPEAIVEAQKRYENFKRVFLSETVYNPQGGGKEFTAVIFRGKAEEGAEAAVDLLLGLNDIPSPITDPDGPSEKKGNVAHITYTNTTSEGIVLVKHIINIINQMQDGTVVTEHWVELTAHAKN